MHRSHSSKQDNISPVCVQIMQLFPFLYSARYVGPASPLAAHQDLCPWSSTTSHIRGISRQSHAQNPQVWGAEHPPRPFPFTNWSQIHKIPESSPKGLCTQQPRGRWGRLSAAARLPKTKRALRKPGVQQQPSSAPLKIHLFKAS